MPSLFRFHFVGLILFLLSCVVQAQSPGRQGINDGAAAARGEYVPRYEGNSKNYRTGYTAGYNTQKLLDEQRLKTQNNYSERYSYSERYVDNKKRVSHYSEHSYSETPAIPNAGTKLRYQSGPRVYIERETSSGPGRYYSYYREERYP